MSFEIPNNATDLDLFKLGFRIGRKHSTDIASKGQGVAEQDLGYIPIHDTSQELPLAVGGIVGILSKPITSTIASVRLVIKR